MIVQCKLTNVNSVSCPFISIALPKGPLSMRNYFFISVSFPIQAGIVPNKRSMNWWKLYIKCKTICLVFIRLLSEKPQFLSFPKVLRYP